MKCENIQDLILTDYIDNEIDKPVKKQIEEHIAICGECRNFLEAARKTALKPFESFVAEVPDDKVWLNIKNEIEKTERKSSLSFRDIISQLGFMLRGFQVPAFALAMISLILLGAVSIRGMVNHQDIAINEPEQIEYLVSVLNLDDEDDVDGFVSIVEEYFL